MRRPVVALAGLVVVGAQRAQGQPYGHFGLLLSTPATASPSTISQADLVERIVDEQVALQTGTCASPWTRGFSTQCPPGSFMALRRGYLAGLGDWVPGVLACQAAGCLHAPGGGDAYYGYLRDEGSIMKEAVAREVSLLVKMQPGTSFDSHLAAMRKSFVKDGPHCKEILSALLREASAGQHEAHATTTTIKFFAELASHRGFVGDEVDGAWIYLRQRQTQEMAARLMRRAPQLLATQIARTFAKVGRDANANTKTITHQKETLMEVQAELSTAFKREREIKEEASSQLVAAEDKVSVLALKLAHVQQSLAGGGQRWWRLERPKLMYDLDDCLDRAEACTTNAEALVEVLLGAKDRLLSLFREGEHWREAAEVCSDSLKEVTATHEEEMESCGKERVAYEQLLASLSGSNDQCECQDTEREANAKTQMIRRQEGTLAKVRAELSVALERGLKKEEGASRLRSQLSAAHERERMEGKKAAKFLSRLSKAHAREREAADKKIAGLSAELADVEKLLAEERSAAAAAAAKAAKAVEMKNVDIKAVRLEERDSHHQAVDNEKAELRAACSSVLVDSERDAATKLADLTSERDEARKMLTDALEAKDEMARTAEEAIQELDEMELGFRAGLEIATEQYDAMLLMSGNYERILKGQGDTIAELETALRVETGLR